MNRLFKIPEVLYIICEQMQRYDLVPLLTVSRLFFDCATPLVWSSLPASAPTILIKLLPEADAYLHTKLSSMLIKSLLDSLKPLDAFAPTRFNLYVPHVKRIVRYCQNKQSNILWNRLLKLVNARPILPNLEVLKISLGATTRDPATCISAYLSPGLVEISHVRNAHSFMEPRGSYSLVSSIAQKCPSIRFLRLTNAASHMYTVMQLTNTSELANSLAQLRDLRMLGIGRVALNPEVLQVLGALPHLESLILNETPGSQSSGEIPKPTKTFLSYDSFPSIQRIEIIPSFKPEPAIRTWNINGLFRCLTSVSVHIDTSLTQIQANEFIRAMCYCSPFIATFCLDCTNSPSYIAVLSPELVIELLKLPLRRLWLLGKDGHFSRPQKDREQLLFLFPEMESFRVKGYYFTVNDLGLFAKYMPRLQQLSIRIEVNMGWSPIIELPVLKFTPPSSQIGLDFRIFHSVQGQRHMKELHRGVSQEVEEMARYLHAL